MNSPNNPPLDSRDGQPDINKLRKAFDDYIDDRGNTNYIGLETTYAQLLLEARLEEVKLLNGLVTAKEFHVPSRHKVYEYMKDRIAELKTLKNKDK